MLSKKSEEEYEDSPLRNRPGIDKTEPLLDSAIPYGVLNTVGNVNKIPNLNLTVW
ncbi:MAG: hypothetical protein ACTSSE_13350 [Candidatus Thorarchaeota archaeon]